MKISYRTHPLLSRLEGEHLENINVHKDDNLSEKHVLYLNETFITHAKQFKSNIFWVSMPFAKAVHDNRKKISSILDDIKNNKRLTTVDDTLRYLGFESISGTMIDSDYTIFYDIKIGSVTVLEFIKIKELIVPTLFFTSDLYMQQPFVSKMVIEEFENPMDYFQKSLGTVINTLMFKKFAEVETKYLPPNKVTKDINCKYVNDTKTGITMLDSKWFTTLVKSDGFTVHGHFRLQPCGKEMKDRKLIWINEFMKTGYTAPARKLAEA